jgi:thiol-disulfide isomerase/thioredoxin
MNAFRLIRLAPVVVLMLGLAACSKQVEVPVMVLPRLGVAPAWKLADVNGKPVDSEQFKGKVVVVDFWATWCGPCKQEIPGYIALQKKYGTDKLAIVGMSVDQAGPDIVKAFIEKSGMNYQVVMADEAVQTAFGGFEAIPTTFLIDATGQIRDKKTGSEETADYEKKIAAVLDEKVIAGVTK